jgi:hypothetical protein
MTHEAAVKAAATRRANLLARVGTVAPVITPAPSPRPAPAAVERLRLAGCEWIIVKRSTPEDFDPSKAAAMRASGQLAHLVLRRPSSKVGLGLHFSIETPSSDGTGRVYSSPRKL